MSRKRKLKKRCMMIFVILFFTVSASAAGKDPDSCTKFLNNPDLYNDCREKNILPSISSVPKEPSEKEDDDACSCDKRQLRKVKERLKKKKQDGN